MNKHPPVRLRVVGVMKTKGSSFSTWYSLDDMICVPLTTHQQRCSGIGYVQNLDVFFQKDAVFDRLIEGKVQKFGGERPITFRSWNAFKK